MERSTFRQSALIISSSLASLVLFVSVLAYWTWAWFAPRPAPRKQIAEQPASAEPPYGLFGGAQRGRNAIAPTGLAIRLLGVAAGADGKSGYGVLQLEGTRIVAARSGEDIAPGIRLVEVQTERIVLERNGVRESLALPDKNKASKDAGLVAQQKAPVEPTVRRERD